MWRVHCMFGRSAGSSVSIFTWNVLVVIQYYTAPTTHPMLYLKRPSMAVYPYIFLPRILQVVRLFFPAARPQRAVLSIQARRTPTNTFILLLFS